jgi:hypothetical protein
MNNLKLLMLVASLVAVVARADEACENVYDNDTHQEEYICYDNPPAPDPSGETSSCEVVWDITHSQETTICH